MIGLIYKDGTTISLFEATRDQLVKWINEAPDIQNRTLRKQTCFARLYNAEPQTIANLLMSKRSKPGSAP